MACTMPSFDAYHKWLGIPPAEQPPNHYRLLGVALFEPDPDVIDAAANRQSTYLQQCASGKQVALSQRLLNEVAAARVCLLNPKKRKAYDSQLQATLQPQPTETAGEDDNPLAFLNQSPPEFDPNAIELAPTPRLEQPSPALPGWIAAVAVLLTIGVCGYIGYRIFGEKPAPLVVADSEEAREAASRSIVSSSAGETADADEGVKRRTSKTSTSSANSKQKSKTAPEETERNLRSTVSKLGIKPNAQSDRPEIRNIVGMDFVFVPKGEFLMGSTAENAADQDEQPRHRVVISRGFFLSKYETTVADYNAVVLNRSSDGLATPKRPIADKSWDDANEFCRLLSRMEDRHYRLPTEAEWEYACRAGTITNWSFGDNHADLVDYAWFDSSAAGASHDVGEKKPNPWGLFDMHGNVGEWCYDTYASIIYGSSRLQDPIGPLATATSTRIVRGGSWDQPPRSSSSAFRAANSPRSSSPRIGFRVLMEADVIGRPSTSSELSHFAALTHDAATGALMTKSSEPSSIPDTTTTEAASEKTPPRPVKVPANAIYWQKHWYWFPDQKAPFKEALRIATSREGRLVTISSAAENTFVTGKLHGPTLIGCAKVNRRWFASAGNPQRYFNWAVNQPSGARGEDFVVIHEDGLWHDDFEDNLHYAVEWGKEE